MRYSFIEIGTSDFDTLIESCSDEQYGLSIEPIKYYLDRLPNKPNVTKINAAVSHSAEDLSIYYISDDKIKEHNLPWWVRGSNSVNHPHPFTIKEIGEKLYYELVTIDKVPTITWKMLLNEYDIEGIDYLKIDTEGYDHIILNDYLDLAKKYPQIMANKIKFEYHPEVSNVNELDKLLFRLRDYHVEQEGTDLILTKNKIPRIIHQTYKSLELPSELQKVVSKLKRMNPTFEYRFYDDGDCIEFIKDHYDEDTLNIYLSINPIHGAARADLFRYLLMYEIGGVYLDIKSCTTVPLETVLLPTDEYLLSHWEGLDWKDELNYVHGEFQNWHIVCAPKHPFLKEAIERVKHNIKNYNSSIGKDAILRLTGPIAYSKAIIPILDIYRKYTNDSPVREFKLSEEIGLTYMATDNYHHAVYGKGYSDEPIIIPNKAYVLYANTAYIPTVTACVRSIKTFSHLPILVYLFNSDEKIEGATTINWKCDVAEIDQKSYIDRADPTIYRLLIERPMIVKDALTRYSTVAYVDSDCVATRHIDSIFDMYDNTLNYPYFVEGIYDYLHIDGRGGADSREDMSTTLEHPACELFGIDQYVRQRYRQTGFFVAGNNCQEFLDTWYSMCKHPAVIANHTFYAPYHEETIVNCLLWKNDIMDGLPLIYTNASLDRLPSIYNDNKWGEYQSSWFKLPDTEEQLLFIHGEKNPQTMNQMTDYLVNNKLRILFLAPHLSTGGMPQFLLKRIEALKDDVEIFVVEYQCHGLAYVVQRNAIMNIVGENFKTLYEDKSELSKIISQFKPDIVHIDDVSERFNDQMIVSLYDQNRSYRIIETCHDISFNPNDKRHTPDAYAFCSPFHLTTFFESQTMKDVIEYPIDITTVIHQDKINAQDALGLDWNKKHILNVGLWTAGKNQGEGLEIARKYPHMQFHFVGNQAGNFQDYWEPLMKNVPNNVTIWGERNDIPLFMEAADIFMFNSTWECNPLVLREAIGYGLPIIARNLPQYEDMFTKYIQPVDTNLEGIRANYSLPFNNTTDDFGVNHKALYKKVSESVVTPQVKKPVTIVQNFIEQPFLEITGDSDSLFKIKFFDENDVCHYENTIKANHWVKLNRQWYTKWNAKVWENDVLIYNETLDYTGKRVLINFDSSSLGDTIAWIPYCLEFQKEHNCHVIVCTFKNFLFEESYPELEFVQPGTSVGGIHGMYRLGWHYDENREPVLPSTIPLQQAASNILGLEYKEIVPRIAFTPKACPYDQEYITIATNSTAGCKFWTKEGWQNLIDMLIERGYAVINVSKEPNPFNGVIQIEDSSMENTMNVIYHSKFLIGLSSGLSWLAWGMDKYVVMISNFTEESHEFMLNCTRITNTKVCNSCWNNPKFTFDKGDWSWCPLHKGTDRQFECHTSITADMVMEEIKFLL